MNTVLGWWQVPRQKPKSPSDYPLHAVALCFPLSRSSDSLSSVPSACFVARSRTSFSVESGFGPACENKLEPDESPYFFP